MSDPTARIKGFFTELVDAVRYSQNYTQVIEGAEKEREKIIKQQAELDELSKRIAQDVKEAEVDPDYVEELAEGIGTFVSAAIHQTRERLEARLKVVDEEAESASHSERLKALRSLESYLASTPIHVLDEEVNADFAEGSYAVTATYKCDGNMQYEFLLNSADSPLFRRPVALSDMAKGIRLPVRLSKTWLRKEPSPGFEKPDQYVLQQAHATRTQLVAKFLNHDTEAALNVVFAKSNGESFMSVEYVDSSGKVDVTGEPSLNKHLDVPTLKTSMTQLLSSVNEMKRQKLRLVALTCDEVDILETLDCFRFMQRVMELLSHSTAEMETIQKLDGTMRAERLKLLGGKAGIVMEALGLEKAGEGRSEGAGQGSSSHKAR